MGKKSPYIGSTYAERPDRWVEPDDVDEYPIEIQLDDWSVIEVQDREMHELLDDHHVKWTERDVYDERYGGLNDKLGDEVDDESMERDVYSFVGVDPEWGEYSTSQE